jgi:hypothetical protein
VPLRTQEVYEMTEAATYNGWPSYPTWAVAVWLDNDERDNEAVRAIAADWNERTKTAGGTVSDVADQLREHVRSFPSIEAVDAAPPSLAGDLLGFALESADWYALALAYVHEALTDDGFEDVETELERRRVAWLGAVLS